MANVVTRKYTDADRPGFSRVRSVTYRGGDPVLPDERILRDDCIGFVCEEGQEIFGASTILDMTARKGSAQLRCGGLAAVGVVPEKRGSGIGSVMMRDMVRLLREDGFDLASLYAFRETYYRKFGYEVCGKRYRVRCPQSRLPKKDASITVRELPAKDWCSIKDCYAKFASRYASMNDRKPDQWWRTLGGDKPLQIYVAGDPIEAYAVMRLNSGFWEDQVVKEFVWTTHESYLALLGLFRSLGINKTAIEWDEPADSPLLASLLDQGIEVQLSRPIMFRMLDVSRCFTVLRPKTAGRFGMQVLDDIVPENDGMWSVQFDENKVEVSRGGAPDFVIDIRQLTQSFFGDPSLSDLARMGLVTVKNPEAFENALNLLQPEYVYCTDFF